MKGKLVRDRIPEIIRASGQEPNIETLDSDEAFGRALDAKLLEEAHEVVIAQTQDQKLEELADLDEVKLARLALLGFTPEDLEQVRLRSVLVLGAAVLSTLNILLVEKALEVGAAKTHEQKLEKIADLEIVQFAILEILGFTLEDLEQARLKKASIRGSFNLRLFLNDN